MRKLLGAVASLALLVGLCGASIITISGGHGSASSSSSSSSSSSGGLTAPGVTGTIAHGQSITIAWDGVNSNGATGPTYSFFDDCSNYGTAGASLTTTWPQIGTYQSSPMEQIVHASGRYGAKGRLVTYVTQAERTSAGAGKREAWARFPSDTAITTVFTWQDLNFIQGSAGNYSGSFWKVNWIFKGATGHNGATLDMVMPTFNGGTEGVAFGGNTGSSSWDITQAGGFGMSKMNMSAGWNVFQSYLVVNPVQGSTDTRRFRSYSSVANYDSGTVTTSPTSITDSASTRDFDRETTPGWYGDGNDARVTGNLELVYGTHYVANNAARVEITPSGSQPTPCRVTSWSTSSITCVIITGNADLTNATIRVWNSSDSTVQYSGGNTRTISQNDFRNVSPINDEVFDARLAA